MKKCVDCSLSYFDRDIPYLNGTYKCRHSECYDLVTGSGGVSCEEARKHGACEIEAKFFTEKEKQCKNKKKKTASKQG